MKTYIIAIFVSRPCRIEVGKLGFIKFPEGYYIYVGSGGRNVVKRISRHFRVAKKVRWHIDYLTNLYPAIDAYVIDGSEEEIAHKLSLKYNYIPGFGSTDKRSVSHLFYIGRYGYKNAIEYLSKYYNVEHLGIEIFII